MSTKTTVLPFQRNGSQWNWVVQLMFNHNRGDLLLWTGCNTGCHMLELLQKTQITWYHLCQVLLTPASCSSWICSCSLSTHSSASIQVCSISLNKFNISIFLISVLFLVCLSLTQLMLDLASCQVTTTMTELLTGVMTSSPPASPPETDTVWRRFWTETQLSVRVSAAHHSTRVHHHFNLINIRLLSLLTQEHPSEIMMMRETRWAKSEC